MPANWFILARAVHVGACLLFFGLWAFDLIVFPALGRESSPSGMDFWRTRLRRLSLVLLPVILLSGIAWFLFVAMTMGGQPLHWDIVKIVWTKTLFGFVWRGRLGIWGMAVMVSGASILFRTRGREWSYLQLLLSGSLLGGLAWAGHGQENSPWHLGADVLHLLVAGLWPAGLWPLLMLLKYLRQMPAPLARQLTARLVRRFSAISLVSVALLGLTGFVNAWCLLGSFANLFHSTYGRWLLVKIILFIITVAIGAVNLLRLKPRLERAGELEPAAAMALQRNVRVELIIGAVVVLVVAVLGILPPPSH